jgi:hypothetical protein
MNRASRVNRNRSCTTALLASASALFLSSCQTSGPGGFTTKSETRALPTMERIAISARNCWFKSGDSEFRPYRLAPELNSFSGRPRVLIVSARAPEGRPLAVIEGHGDPATVEVYGPLLEQSIGGRIKTDVERWTGGSTDCKGTA